MNETRTLWFLVRMWWQTGVYGSHSLHPANHLVCIQPDLSLLIFAFGIIVVWHTGVIELRLCEYYR